MTSYTFYLAGRYSRRVELLGYATALRAAGQTVRCTWLDGEHEAEDGIADRNTMATWAKQDYAEISYANRFLLFTSSEEAIGKGGHMVELGIALAWQIPVAVIGPLTNVFTQLLTIKQYGTWQEFWAAEFAGSGEGEAA